MLSLNTFSQLLTTRYSLLLILALALILPLPSINKGLQTDDYLHWAVFQSSKNCANYLTNTACGNKTLEALDDINSLFTFIEPNSSDYQNAKSIGSLPWWTSSELKINFWRPLAAFTHWLDYQWWPNNPKLMHLQNIFWYVLLLLSCFYFYRSIIKNDALAHYIIPLATLLFCLDFSNFANISWLANRNSLICALMCVLTLIAHNKWRVAQQTHFLIASQLLLVLALASNESGLIAFLWVCAYNMVYEKSTIKEKILASLPSLITLFAWQLLYKYLGYGFSDSGLYLHPINDFFVVAPSIIEKLPVFIFSQIFGIEGFYNGIAPNLRYLFSFSCFSIAALFIFGIYKSIPINKTIYFLALCTILAFIPASAFALVEIRMSLYAGIFSALIFSYIIIHGYQQLSNKKNTFTLRIISFVLIFSHIILASAQWTLQWKHISLSDFSLNYSKNSSKISQLTKPLLGNNSGKNYKGKDIIILSAPAAIDYYYLPYFAQYHSLETPNSINLLALNYTSYELSVINKNTLELTSSGLLLNRYTQRNIFNSLGWFSPWYSAHDLNGVFSPMDSNLESNIIGSFSLIAKIEEKNINNQITKLTFIFNENIDDDNYIFLYWDKNKYTELSYSHLKEFTYKNQGI